VNHIELSAMYPPSRIGASPPILRLARPDQVIDNDQTGRNPMRFCRGLRQTALRPLFLARLPNCMVCGVNQIPPQTVFAQRVVV
jgi:hypothetical protein